jgi:hypothetical protein
VPRAGAPPLHHHPDRRHLHQRPARNRPHRRRAHRRSPVPRPPVSRPGACGKGGAQETSGLGAGGPPHAQPLRLTALRRRQLWAPARYPPSGAPGNTARSEVTAYGTAVLGREHWNRKGGGFTARSSYTRSTPLTSADALQGVFRGYRRPLCVRGHRVPGPCGPRTGTDPRTARKRLRTGPAGAVMLTVPPGFSL